MFKQLDSRKVVVLTSMAAIAALANLGCPHALGQTQWTQLSPTGGPPPPRGEATAVFDTATRQMILFGGGNPDFNDTWSLGPIHSPQWTQLTPSGAPPAPREVPASVYDEKDSRMIVFGGGEGSTSPCENDVWVLSNANGVDGAPAWSQLSPSGMPPSPRYAPAVYDEPLNTMIIFGGDDCFSTLYNDVWTLSDANGADGTPTWKQLSPGGTPPSPRDAASAVYDRPSNTMIVFGGGTASGTSNEVWTLSHANGRGGAPVWTELFPSGIPPAGRGFHSAVYEPSSNVMVVFGGYSDSGYLNDVWELSHANGLDGTPTWTQLSPSGATISARFGQTTVLDRAKGEMIVFGGYSPTGGGLLNDTWVLSGLKNLP